MDKHAILWNERSFEQWLFFHEEKSAKSHHKKILLVYQMQKEKYCKSILKAMKNMRYAT